MPSPAGAAARLSTDDLRRRLHTRLDRLGQERPDLEPALRLQRNLLTREIELLEAYRAGGLPGLSLPPRYLVAKLNHGIPALHAEPVPLALRALTLTLRDFCARLAKGSMADAVTAALGAFDTGGLDPALVLSACFGRDQQRVRVLGAHFGASPDLLWLVAELSLAPFAHLLQRQILAGEAVDAALVNWDRGFCPACGSWPALIEAGDDGHVLRCSFCARAWELLTYRCIYCGNDADGFITAAPDLEHPGRRLQLCGSCGGYVKVLQVEEAGAFPLAAIEDLASLDLDMAAMERNYVRPALAEIRKAPLSLKP